MLPPEHIRYVLGLSVPLEEFMGFLAQAGAKTWTPAPLPDMRRGEPKQCFANATQVVMDDPDLHFCEGIAKRPETGVWFLHAWAVDNAGIVVDTTWERPESCVYYGVRYDRSEYLGHIFRHEAYGVFGGNDGGVREVLKLGGLRKRKEPGQKRPGSSACSGRLTR